MARVRVKKGYHPARTLLAQAAKACAGLPRPQFLSCVSQYIKKAKHAPA